MRIKKSYIYILMLLMIVGFATVSIVLFINGNVEISSSTNDFDMYYSRVLVNGVENKYVVTDKTHITFDAELKSVGDQYKVEYFITNASRNYDADVSMMCTSGNSYISIANTWVDHTIIDSTSTKNGVLIIKMIKAYSGNNSLVLNVDCEINADAVERDTLGSGTPSSPVEPASPTNPENPGTSDNIDEPGTPDEREEEIKQVSFATDSWETIKKAVQSGNYIYRVGDTKTIKLAQHTNNCSSYTGSGANYVCNSSVEAEKDFIVRVANTTPCTNGETSETACGFVVEFTSIIEKHNFNPGTSSYTFGTNIGGWKDSSIRSYVNSNLFNALPQDLRSVIADTKVISSHGSTSGESNYTSVDKLYLLNAQELWGTNSNDSSVGTSRQLDYYKSLGVTADKYSGAIKQYNGSAFYWWLRSSNSVNATSFLIVITDGRWNQSYGYPASGVSPAFRIA